MRKIIILLIIVMLIPLNCMAAQYTDEADILFDIGLFKGTEKGYELDKTLTRAEAAVMIARFYGAESMGINGYFSENYFDDVYTHWARSYINYCYKHEITKGTGEKTFSPEKEITAQEYTSLLLRAMGYKYANPDNVHIAAAELSLADSEEINRLFEGSFTRDKMVHISYKALGVKTPNDKYLIDEFIKKQVVLRTIAEKYTFYNDRIYIE